MPVENDLEQKRQSCQRMYESGQLTEASRLLSECLAIDHKDPRTIELQGMILYSHRQYRESVRQLETASVHVPLRLVAQTCLAHGYAQIGKRQLSCDLLQALSERPQISVELLLQVARGLDFVDRPDLAVETCRKASLQRPNSAQVWYDMGFYIGRCGGEPSEVEALARKAISIAPGNTRFRVGLCGFLSRQDRLADAYTVVADLTKAQIESVCCASCLQRMTTVYEKARDYRRVVIARQQLVLLPPGNDDCGA